METDKASPTLSFCCFLSLSVPSVPQVHVLAMIPADVPLSHLGPMILMTCPYPTWAPQCCCCCSSCCLLHPPSSPTSGASWLPPAPSPTRT